MRDFINGLLYIGDEEYDNRPTWQKVLIILFVLALPFIGSYNG